MITHTNTPRAKRCKAIKAAIAEASRVAACNDTWIAKFDNELAKAGYKVTKATWREKERLGEVSPSVGNSSTARGAVTVTRGVTV